MIGLLKAYGLIASGRHRVLVLTSARSWALASAPSVAAGHTPVPSWTVMAILNNVHLLVNAWSDGVREHSFVNTHS